MTKLLPVKQVIILVMAASLLFTVAFGASKFVKASSVVTISTSYMTLSVDPTGTYTITVQNPHWHFVGAVGQSLTNVVTNAGTDSIGQYQEIVFNYQDQTGGARGAGIRIYQATPVVLFSDSYLSPNASNTAPFPHLTNTPIGLYSFSYPGAYAHIAFWKRMYNSPWVFYNANKAAYVFSPASDFLIASSTQYLDKSISNGINPVITTLPQGFTHKTFLVVGQGINNVLQTWGLALTSLTGKNRAPRSNDRILSTLGYYTDSKLPYSFNFVPNLGYEGTLLAVKNSFTKAGIPLGYMQLDGWWYPKGWRDNWKQHGMGIYTYNADPTLFPNGLLSFQQQLGLPLLLHAKFIDTSSPYRTQYTMSNNVSTDPKYWKYASGYVSANGGIGFEQDWLNDFALPATNLTDPSAFFDNMANSMAADGVTIQYCMELPSAIMQSSMYDNVTHLRVSGDRFDNTQWTHMLYTSRFARSVGAWPWSDAFFSTETDNLLLSTLTAGPVGVGDAIDTESATNLFKTIRADGVIVKPDDSIMPIDDMYVDDIQGLGMPMVASTYTDFGGGMKQLYVFAYQRGTQTTATFNPASLGLTGSTYVYNYFTGTGTIVPPGGSFSDTVTTGSYYIVVPIGPSGIGFLGDAGKFVSLGKNRISQLTDNGTVQATITFAQGETSVTIHGYSPASPVVTASDGSVGTVSYNSSTHLFSVPVSPGVDGSAAISIS